MFYAEDVGFDIDSTLESVARLFDKGKVVDGKFDYEGRTLCHPGMIVSSQVTDEREGHQSAFFDAGRGTRCPFFSCLPCAYTDLACRWHYHASRFNNITEVNSRETTPKPHSKGPRFHLYSTGVAPDLRGSAHGAGRGRLERG